MALSIGFRTGSFLPALLFKLRGLDFYPGGTFTHCSCQPSLDAPSSALILADRQPAQLTQLSRPRRSLAPISNLVSPCLASRSAASPPFWQHRRQLRQQLSLPQLPALLG